MIKAAQIPCDNFGCLPGTTTAFGYFSCYEKWSADQKIR
jgi:hypothetical protein